MNCSEQTSRNVRASYALGLKISVAVFYGSCVGKNTTYKKFVKYFNMIDSSPDYYNTNGCKYQTQI